MQLAVLVSCDRVMVALQGVVTDEVGGVSVSGSLSGWCDWVLVVLVSCGGAASEQLDGIGVVGVNAAEGGFGNHCSPVGFTNAAAISIEIDRSVE